MVLVGVSATLLLDEVVFGEVEVLLPGGGDGHPLPQLRVGARHAAHHLDQSEESVVVTCPALHQSQAFCSSPASKTRNQAPCTDLDPSHVHPEEKV